jgi:hypothetical protein
MDERGINMFKKNMGWLGLGANLVSVTGFCPGYIPFGISTLTRERYSTELS